MKKWILALLCMVAASMVMSGCAAGNASGLATVAPAATNSPAAATMEPSAAATMESPMQATAQPMTSPDASGSPEGTASSAMTAMTPAQAGKLAEQISEAVERISEVKDAEVIVRDERVLVAVEFEDQYSASLDDRMKQTIVDAVKKVDDSLTDVQITDDGTLYGQVKGLAERVGKVTGLDELADDFGDLWDRITGR
ncbi:MAG: YhcN/YlaJ family sporulation lipoprotein [Clostridia bacterium]|nr:YhcN/YlaJ family sporulation lipoprotein [Clostridia bacterium]